MLMLIFEVLPKPDREAAYFEMAAALKPTLDDSGGLLFLDRSRSDDRPGWFLSHQYWRDEASMARWRANGAHHRAQVCGRTDILADYRLRVGQVIAEIGPDLDVFGHGHESAVAYDQGPRTARYILTVATRGHGVAVASGASRFQSVYEPDLGICIIEVASRAEGENLLSTLASQPTVAIARLSLISRDYGMFDRSEAPQFFEPVTLA